MKTLTNILIPLFVIFCTLTNLSAQGPTVGSPVYDPYSGKTVYRTGDGGIVQYGPTTTGSEVTVIRPGGGTTVIDCSTQPTICQDILEDGADGNPPNLPEEPADGGEDPEPTTESGPSSTQVWKEYLSYSKRNKGKMYFRSKSGKWSVVKDWQAMHKKILMSINKR